jgi:hypothetical protein
MSGYEYVDSPEGWGGIAFFARLVNAGVCGIGELARPPATGGLTIRQVFDLHRMLDWRDYCDSEIAERSKQHGRR